MAVRGRESILRARDGVQSRGRGKRRRGRELLVISPFASSRRSSMVGLAGAEVLSRSERPASVHLDTPLQ
jgi:hypothetical protein